VRVVLQRVSRASVSVDDSVVGSVGRGYVVLVGVKHDDGVEEIDWMAEKILTLRLFPDDEGKMNRSLVDIGGAVLAVSQFTLYGDARKGRRPSFVHAAPPEVAEPLYERFVGRLRALGLEVATGAFGAMMDVELINDGPVTLVLER
jgi:D-tyrosyl-tRNA(Tyr) deacylase